MTDIHEQEHLRNRIGVFRDRYQAGDVLGRMLEPCCSDPADVILLAIPMGGVPVAYKIRERLGCPMDLAIVRKLQIPGNTEAGFGAATSEGDFILNKPLMAQLALTEQQIERERARVREELARRNRQLRGERPFPDLEGKTVILADDGLASGFTMKAAVTMVNKRKAAKTIIAVATAPRRTIDALAGGVDAIYCPNIREVISFAVAEAYENWHDLTETEVRDLI
jgi:predicted phosphoribosyltransferase